MVVPNKTREEQKNCANVSHNPPRWLYPGKCNWMCPACGLVSRIEDGNIVANFVLVEFKNDS